jgi:hypothetical protein
MAVGGSVASPRSHTMQGQTVCVKAFGVATYLYGKGIRPLRTALSSDGDGVVVFLFGPEAEPEIAQYRADKARLMQMMTETTRTK